MFSVIMPTYNYADDISDAIQSVIEQELSEWEMIVITDGCTDDTVDVLKSLHDSRVRVVVVNTHTGSPGHLRNLGIAEARGEIVCYLDHDDRWSEDHLVRLAAAYQDPQVRVVATGCRRIDDDGQVVGATVPVNMAWHPELQVVSPIFEPSRVSHRRSAAERVGGWTGDRLGLEDWDLWVRLADAGEAFTLLAERSVSCRLHPRSRRHTLGHRYLLTFGPPVSAAAAKQILQRAEEPDARRELGRRFRADVVAWYRALAATGQLRLAAGLTLDDLLAGLESDLGDPPFAPHLRPYGEQYVLCRILACRSRAHAERIVAVNRRRMTATSAYLNDLMAPRAAR